jgi:hypothetical protein
MTTQLSTTQRCFTTPGVVFYLFLPVKFLLGDFDMNDFLFRGPLSQVDPELDNLINFEAERQVSKLILIPSESSAPESVRESLGSVFQNLYAEGYPTKKCAT